MNNLIRPLFVVLSLIVIGLPVSLAQPLLHPQRPRSQSKEILTNASVIELAQLGLGDAIIIEKIRRSERNFDTSIEGLKQLKAAALKTVRVMSQDQVMTQSQAQNQKITITELKDIKQAPQTYLNERIQMRGRLRFIGLNYFTDPRFVLVDEAGTDILVSDWVPLVVSPPRPDSKEPVASSPKSMRDYVDRWLLITGTLRVDPTSGNYKIEIESVIEDPTGETVMERGSSQLIQIPAQQTRQIQETKVTITSTHTPLEALVQQKTQDRDKVVDGIPARLPPEPLIQQKPQTQEPSMKGTSTPMPQEAMVQQRQQVNRTRPDEIDSTEDTKGTRKKP